MTATREDAVLKQSVRQGPHAMVPQFAHDEEARQLFVQSLKVLIASTLQPGTKTAYHQRVRPAFEKAHGRPPADLREMRQAMMADPYVQMWSALKRDVQEMTFDAVDPAIERQLPALIERARAARMRNDKLGSLVLDPSVEAPRYNTAVDIHCKPGGYHSERLEDDVMAGASFDRSLFLHSMGLLGPHADDMGLSLAHWARDTYPDLAPARILDMGCTIGNSTLPWVDVFPDAEVVAIDVAAPCLRYGHARAESLGKAVQFMQMDAEATRFPDASFDLVVSHILLHETSNKALRNIFRESYRLLKPGGLMLHLDGPQYHDMDLVDQFIPDWDVHYNNEPFVTTLHQLDLPAVVAEAGFARDAVFETFAPSVRMGVRNGPKSGERWGNWYVIGARR